MSWDGVRRPMRRPSSGWRRYDTVLWSDPLNPQTRSTYAHLTVIPLAREDKMVRVFLAALAISLVAGILPASAQGGGPLIRRASAC